MSQHESCLMVGVACLLFGAMRPILSKPNWFGARAKLKDQNAANFEKRDSPNASDLVSPANLCCGSWKHWHAVKSHASALGITNAFDVCHEVVGNEEAGVGFSSVPGSCGQCRVLTQCCPQSLVLPTLMRMHRLCCVNHSTHGLLIGATIVRSKR